MTEPARRRSARFDDAPPMSRPMATGISGLRAPERAKNTIIHVSAASVEDRDELLLARELAEGDARVADALQREERQDVDRVADRQRAGGERLRQLVGRRPRPSRRRRARSTPRPRRAPSAGRAAAAAAGPRSVATAARTTGSDVTLTPAPRRACSRCSAWRTAARAAASSAIGPLQRAHSAVGAGRDALQRASISDSTASAFSSSGLVELALDRARPRSRPVDTSSPPPRRRPARARARPAAARARSAPAPPAGGSRMTATSMAGSVRAATPAARGQAPAAAAADSPGAAGSYPRMALTTTARTM